MKSHLTEDDIQNLATSFITRELATRAQLFRVNSADGARLVGRNGGANLAGMVFPNYWPGDEAVRAYRLRRDQPDLEKKPNGDLKEKNKYLSQSGSANLLYFMPGTLGSWLQDADLPIVITEGEKKTIALYRLAFHATEGDEPRFLPIGLSGVWNWRGKVSKTTNEKGASQDIKGPISDLDNIMLKDRKVYIIFDSNVATNDNVKVARQSLAKELKRRGAIVRLVDLPHIEGLNGVDDLLAANGPEFVLSIIAEADSEQDSDERPARKSQATLLVELTGNAELFCNPEGDPYASVNVGEHKENWPLKSRGFQDWLMRRFYEETGSAPSAQAIKDAVGVLNGKARFDGPISEVFIRIAEHEGAIFLDLCDEMWRVIHITREGWRILNDSPIKFRRTKGMLPLPEPIHGGCVNALRQFVNVTNEDWPLILAWLVATFRPKRPFPILALNGEQGSAKSTTSRVLRSLVDPNKAALRSVPRDERDLMIAATNGWLVALDNLSHLQVWLSDALCRLATGGGFATRELYANDEEVLFDVMRPVLLNGIEELATRSDLLDRVIVITLPVISDDKRRDERDVWPAFEAARPLILGALLDAISHALCHLNDLHLERLPRMADFALWATAAENALGLANGTFIATYVGNREAANDLALEASVVAATLIAFIERERQWTGTATALLKELNAIAGDEALKQQGWPKRANALSGILTRLAPNLRAAGVEFRRLRREGRKGNRLIQLEHKKSSSASSDCQNIQETSENLNCSADDTPTSDDSSDIHLPALKVMKNGHTVDADDADDPLQCDIETEEEIEERKAVLDYYAGNVAAEQPIASNLPQRRPFIDQNDIPF